MALVARTSPAMLALLRATPPLRHLRTRRIINRPLTSRAPIHHKSAYGYTQAQALVFSKYGEPSEVLSVHTHSISPSVPDDAVVLRTLAAPINPADVNMIQGTYATKLEFSTILGTTVGTAVPGSEGCFEVIRAGSAVRNLKPGDWCIPATLGLGTWRSHLLVSGADQALLPVARTAEEKQVLNPLETATIIVNPCTAYCLLRNFVDLIQLTVDQYNKGDGSDDGGALFLQNGANSAVGRAVIQLARHWGLRSINVIRERPTATETDALKRELMDLGATVVVSDREFMSNSFFSTIKSLTKHGHHPIMLGLNCVGGKSAKCLYRYLTNGATMVTYGGMAKLPVDVPTSSLIFKDLTFRGFWLTRWTKQNKEAKTRMVEELLDMLREGTLKIGPVDEIPWNSDTDQRTLSAAVQSTLHGYRSGKGVFVFGND